jgi:hypothetical protein
MVKVTARTTEKPEREQKPKPDLAKESEEEGGLFKY